MLTSRLFHLRCLITAETPAYGPGKHYLPTREPGPLFFSEKQKSAPGVPTLRGSHPYPSGLALQLCNAARCNKLIAQMVRMALDVECDRSLTSPVGDAEGLDPAESHVASNGRFAHH